MMPPDQLKIAIALAADEPNLKGTIEHLLGDALVTLTKLVRDTLRAEMEVEEVENLPRSERRAARARALSMKLIVADMVGLDEKDVV